MKVMDIITEYKITGHKKKYKEPKSGIKQPSILAKFARSLYKGDINVYESCYLICFDPSNNINGYIKVSQGARNAALVDIGLVGKFMIDTLCIGIAIVHNHPSGKTVFSEEDKNLARKIANLSEMLSVNLLDSMVVTDDDYCSMMEEGILSRMKSDAKRLIQSFNENEV